KDSRLRFTSTSASANTTAAISTTSTLVRSSPRAQAAVPIWPQRATKKLARTSPPTNAMTKRSHTQSPQRHGNGPVCRRRPQGFSATLQLRTGNSRKDHNNRILHPTRLTLNRQIRVPHESTIHLYRESISRGLAPRQLSSRPAQPAC